MAKTRKGELKEALQRATGCRVQHTGWPCGTCFFSISEVLDNKDWQTVLYVRGDYAREDLDNLPNGKEIMDATINRIIKIATKA